MGILDFFRKKIVGNAECVVDDTAPSGVNKGSLSLMAYKYIFIDHHADRLRIPGSTFFGQFPFLLRAQPGNRPDLLQILLYIIFPMTDRNFQFFQLGQAHAFVPLLSLSLF